MSANTEEPGHSDYILGGYLILAPLLFTGLLVVAWPIAISEPKPAWQMFFGPLAPAAAKPTGVTNLLGVRSSEVIVLLLVAVSGALGGALNSAYKFAIHKGLGQFNQNWIWWYVMHPVFGMVLGLLMGLLLQAGLLTLAPQAGEQASAPLNPAALAAIAGLTGMFARKGIAKLDELFDTILKAPKVQDAMDAKTPVIDKLDPAETQTGATKAEVVVIGRYFDPKAIVKVNGTACDAAADGDGRLKIALPADVLQGPATLQVTVINPGDAGLESKPATFEVK
ncbi:hypothetical protein [Rhizobium sp. SGZ-381]|uniref:hypothetical protein n=1 Tax=Rhizobium sp. SGZ-381 TaxID=3342800 RepID=UPI00366F3341